MEEAAFRSIGTDTKGSAYGWDAWGEARAGG